MKSLLFAISAACCVCVAGARVVDGNLALNVQDGDVQTFDEDLLFQGWSRVFTIPAGVTAVFNGNLAMATPEGNSVFVGGSESTLGRPGVRGRVREGPRTNGKSKCSETRPMGAGRRQIESVALCVWQCHLRNVSTLSNRTQLESPGALEIVSSSGTKCRIPKKHYALRAEMC